MKVTDYIRNLAFYQYAETYSFRRDKDFLEARHSYIKEQERLNRRERNGKLISADEEQNLETLRKQADLPLYILNEENELNPSAARIFSFGKEDTFGNKIESLLLNDSGDAPYWMCAPEYRDAIIFYDASHNIVSALNICFGCSYMRTRSIELGASEETYKALKALFSSVGHPIEE